jgi:RIO kinase 1
VEDGIIDEVLGQVRSGKEADVFLVRVGDETRCAKVYKDSAHRSFKQAAAYQEGRRVQNSRSSRALSKRSAFGQKEAETNWITAEVQALTTLSAAGVRVPKPHGFFDGVLIMELVVDESGDVAPRLDDLELSIETAGSYHQEMIRQIVLMLCAGIIHGDLSEFNVLVDSRGPVIIDLPQAVNAAGNNNARMMLRRDVDNMARYFGRFDPSILRHRYAEEIWALYQNGLLTPDVQLTGVFEETGGLIDLAGVLEAIEDARRENEERVARRAPRPEVSVVDHAAQRWTAREAPARGERSHAEGADRPGGKADGRGRSAGPPTPRGSSPSAEPYKAPLRVAPPRPKPTSIPETQAPAPVAKPQWGRRPQR